MKYCFFIITILSGIFTTAQNLNYKGVIVNDNLQEDYLVILTNIENPNIVFSENTIANNFSFKNIPKGKYERCLLANFNKQCDTLTIETSTENNIIHLEKKQELKEIKITSKRPLIENRNGVLKINIENSTIMSTGSAFETITKLPGITYNHNNETFKLKGKDGIQIQLDGQNMYISGNELTALLKSISAEDISNIEINSSPSAKNDANGNGGSIAINTKKNKKKGVSLGFSLSGTQGKYYKHNAGLKIQFNTKKRKYSLNYINSDDVEFENADVKRDFYQNTSKQNTYAKINGKTNTLIGQIENSFSKSNIHIRSTASFYQENIVQNTNSLFFDKNNELFSNTTTSQKSKNKLNNFDFSLTYKLTFTNSDLIFKSNYLHYNIENNSELKIYEFPKRNNFENLDNKSPNKISLFVYQADYTKNIDSLSHYELGIKYILQNIDTENIFYKINPRVIDEQKSNDYRYKEHIIAGYLQYYKSVNKFDFTLGGRLEYNPSIGYATKNEYTLNREQTNFFPFLNIAYNYSDTNNFNFSYSRRINRPSFKDLMPFVYYVDPYTQLVGNPKLTSSLSNQIEFQYIHKKNYIFSFSYSLINNSIYQTPIQDNVTLNTYLTPLNIDKIHSLSVSANMTFNLTKWWFFNINAIGFYDKIISSEGTLPIHSKQWTNQYVTINSFSLPKKLKFELSTDYVSPFIQGSYKTDNLFMINVSMSKNINDNLKFSITANDILKTYNVKNISLIENQSSRMNQSFDTQWIRLSLFYKFNKGLKKENIINDENNEELKSRVK